MALKNADIYPDSYIAVIDDTSAEKVCIAEIHSIAPSYRIQPEYLDRWGAENPDTVVSASEVVSLSHDWGTPVEELLGQLRSVGRGYALQRGFLRAEGRFDKVPGR